MRTSRKVFGAVGVLIAVGAVLARPGNNLTPSEEARAFQAVGSKDIPDGRGDFVEVTFVVPNDEGWKRITRLWGDPGYAVAVLSKDRHLSCFDAVVLSISVKAEEESAPVDQMKNPLYGYSADCPDEGIKIRPRPGASVVVHAELTSQARLERRGRLIVVPYWSETVKDRLVGSELDRYLARALGVLAFVGSLLAGWAFWPRTPMTSSPKTV